MLYGDGIHSDLKGIQELLDSREPLVYLPAPKKCYLIDKALRIYSGQTLKLDSTTVIRLMPYSNCLMLKNDPEDGRHDIHIEGGIWDYNNLEQKSNPLIDGSRKHLPTHFDGKPATTVTYTDDYFGSIMRFWGVKRLTISGLTYKNPVTYCLHMAETEYFTVENVRFDMNYGNPHPINMDGVHIDGGCRFGMIHNVQGTCYDDVVALNADDGHDGFISDIVIDGVYANDALRGVRLLSTKSPVSRISISNVFGTYYQNAILIGYFYTFSGIRGKFDHIVIRNEFASQAPRLPIYHKKPAYEFALIEVQGQTDVSSLQVDCAHRREEYADIEMVRIREEAHVGVLSLSHVSQENLTGKEFPMISIDGIVDRLITEDISTDSGKIIVVNGSVGEYKEV